jgi:chromosome segregation ATPase
MEAYLEGGLSPEDIKPTTSQATPLSYRKASQHHSILTNYAVNFLNSHSTQHSGTDLSEATFTQILTVCLYLCIQSPNVEKR